MQWIAKEDWDDAQLGFWYLVFHQNTAHRSCCSGGVRAGLMAIGVSCLQPSGLLVLSVEEVRVSLGRRGRTRRRCMVLLGEACSGSCYSKRNEEEEIHAFFFLFLCF